MRKLTITVYAVVLILILGVLFYSVKISEQKQTIQDKSNIIDSLTQENEILRQKIDSLESLLRFPIIQAIERNQNLVATSYNSLPAQCWGNPYETASQTHVSLKTLALSQDMITFWLKYRPKGKFCYGDTVWLLFLKAFIVEDTMHERYTQRVDIWNDDYQESVLFGKQKVFLLGETNE